MKKVRVTRRMLEAYVQKLLTESLSAGAPQFAASPDAVAGVVGSILSGGTDYGQHFESVLINYLNSEGLNAADLNPAGSTVLDVEDEPNQQNKT